MIKASEYCVKIFDGTHDTPKPTQDGEYLVTSKCLLDGKIDFSLAYKISEDDYDEVNRRSQVSQYDILFSMIGTIGNTYLEESSDINYAIKNIGVFSCRNREKAIFLYYYLQSPYAKKYIKRSLDGAVQKFLSLEKMRNFPVSEFSESAYKAISELRRIDDKISTNNKIIETSEKLMREIYDYWFVQFDFPNENGRPYKSSGGKMKWNEKLKREIPDGWRSTKLKGLYKIERGISYSSKDIESSSGTPMINLACVDISRNYRDGGIKLYDGKFSSANVVKADDLIIACTDLTRNADIVGSPILVPDDGREYVFSMDMAKISSFSEELDNMYLYATLRTNYYHSFIKYWASGINALHLNLSGLDWYPVWLPPIKLQKTFAEIVRNINANSGLLRKENASLASLRDWLLPMLMGGQIKIGD